jgi:ribosome-associated toxin RatA of RatAB toxin-antitoxin module
MKRLTGSATQQVSAPIEQCFTLLEAVEGYPRWHPDVVREVAVVERADDGHPVRARTELHVARGPLTKNFHLLMAIAAVRPASVTLTRISHGPSDEEEFEVRWGLASADGGTSIRLDIDASLSVPRMLPLGDIGDALARGFVSSAADALRRAG